MNRIDVVFAPGPDGDVGVRFDLCNITVARDIKRRRCDFWHATVDRYWDIEQWLPQDKDIPHRDLVRAAFMEHVNVNVRRGDRREEASSRPGPSSRGAR
eukprot:COSAG06_NODE_556_length_14336_cov_8.683290_7_plen_99_part_00